MTETTNSPPAPPRPAAPSLGAGQEPKVGGTDPTRLSTADPPTTSSPGAVAAQTLDPHVPSVPPPEPQKDPYIGVTIDGRYKIEGLLGEGGMGVVYRGRHKVIDKPVAIKVLRADMARDAEITERFLREARAASAIGNPHIIDISDFGTLPDGSTYFVMEFLAGTALTALVEGTNEPVPVTRLIHIARQIADGLAAAHERQIVHRDLKPDNIFLVDRGSEKDFIKILDFGIAKVSSGTAKLTRHGSVFGTPHYMSPEQAAGAPLDHRTDIYSLGVIMYEMASGKLPFDADNFMGILTQHMYQAPVPIRALVPPQDVPPGLEAVVLKCLSKKPEQRYADMAELIEDLDKLVKGMVPDAVGEMMARSGGFNVPADFFKSSMPVPVPATPPGMDSRKPWPLIAGIASVIVAISIVVGIFAYSQYGTASTGAHSATPPLSTSAPVAATAPVDPPVEPSATAPTAPAKDVSEVMVVAEPIDAEIFIGDEKQGISPATISVPKGQKVAVTVRSPGFIEQTFELDGSKKRKDVILQRKGGRPPVKTAATSTGKPPPTSRPPVTRPPPTSKPPSTVGGGEIVNPWAK